MELKEGKMLVRDVIKLCCSYLQLTEFLQVIDNDNEVELNPEYLSERDLLVTCANLTFDFIASDYVPLLKSVKVTTSDGKINYSSLMPGRVKDIYSVKNAFGQKVVYKNFDTYLKTVVGTVEIVFSYLPPTVNFYSKCDFFTKLSERILAYGIASEYCFIKGLYEDANVWDTRLKQALLSACRKKGDIIVKKREWI